MNAYCKPEPCVTSLLAAHETAWDRFNAAWAAAPEDGAPEHTVEALTSLHDDLRKAAPASMAEFFEKWCVIAKFDAALGDPVGYPCAVHRANVARARAA